MAGRLDTSQRAGRSLCTTSERKNYHAHMPFVGLTFFERKEIQDRVREQEEDRIIEDMSTTNAVSKWKKNGSTRGPD